jgi:FAD binding domain
LAGVGRARLIGIVRDQRADHADTLRFQDVSSQAIDHLKVQIKKMNWFSTYHVHYRVTQGFRKGRAFLLGDAAHVHSPAGGQGMNTGIGDAINLAWKLSAVLGGRASDELLDSYEIERIGFARRLVATTDRVFRFATAEGRIADLLRTRVAPLVIPKVARFEVAREYLFRTVSQITLNYRGGPLSQGSAGHVRGGDRLPWVVTGDKDNFATLGAMTWQVHVYGEATGDLIGWCTRHNLPLHVIDWGSEHEGAGLARDALYLLRPDTYVALADASGAADTLERYFAERRIAIPRGPREVG